LVAPNQGKATQQVQKVVSAATETLAVVVVVVVVEKWQRRLWL